MCNDQHHRCVKIAGAPVQKGERSEVPSLDQSLGKALALSVPWKLWPQNRADWTPCSRGRLKFPAIQGLTPKIASG